MKIIRKTKTTQNLIKKLKKAGKTIGFVPTMGALHEGHLSLIKYARGQNDILVVSIFVNPIQFGPKEDLKKYPRPIKEDIKRLKEHKVDVLFYPTVEEMYPVDFSTFVVEEQLSKGLCGKYRPGHFNGVTTVVLKLFNIIQPDRAYFGQKDPQQAVVIKKMVRDLNIPVKIIVRPIVRDKDGLALSSRNQYLSPEEREQATALYKALLIGKKGYGKPAVTVRKQMLRFLEKYPLVKVQYIEFVDKNTLVPVKRIQKGTMIAIAGFAGKTRLIDNLLV